MSWIFILVYGLLVIAGKGKICLNSFALSVAVFGSHDGCLDDLFCHIFNIESSLSRKKKEKKRWSVDETIIYQSYALLSPTVKSTKKKNKK